LAENPSEQLLEEERQPLGTGGRKMTEHRAKGCRRIVLGLIAALALSFPAGGTRVGAQAVMPITGDPVATPIGKIAGKLLGSGVRAYLGIPYAVPPVRELRWREPQSPKPWAGVYNADRFAPECIQVLRRHNLNHYFGEEPTSEDCLYLNIWVPADAKREARLPVLVYIYGGGFTIGSAGMALYGGESVARSGAIFVNFNYRLGALGFMAHPELTKESPHNASGNYGLLDQVAALQWIKSNIASFGGDPDNVTISGQSAGSSSVAFLQASPLAKRLFQRAVGFSGSPFGNADPVPTRAEAEKAGLAIQQALGTNSFSELRELPADKILAIQRDCQLGCAGTIRVGPSIDGYFLLDTPAAVFASAQHNDVPLLVGFTSDESSNDLSKAKSLAEYRAAAQRLYGDRADAFLRLYPAATDAEAREIGHIAAREGMMEGRMRAWAKAQGKWGKSPIYMFMFSRVHPFSEGVKFHDDPASIGSYHTSDVPYWLGTQDALNLFRATREWNAHDRALSERMLENLVAFAKSGDPSTATAPWPKWSIHAERLLDFGDAVSIRPMDTERLDFIQPAGSR
jgi:para-nitrobenzyl esterase